ncbi:hypothetical protein [Leuconostoc gasicomitatum]|uniref:hypothetical protein n=1 Tax=Leuconostoc gasicomitatum TaxID=115778 RepID=UPI0007E05BF8|nr:hypothetical protein [Leuconostoc gasicomitatum]CUW06017.1 FIG00773365: hypothetical protein [Leuconostoc gasicomitatum]
MTILYSFIDTAFNLFGKIGSKIDQFKNWFLEHQRRNIIAIFLSFVFVAMATTVGVIITPRPSNLPSTPLYTAVPFGTLNKSATLTKSVFNEKNGVLELHYTIYDGGESNQSFVDISKVYFTVIADRGGQLVTAKSVPTSNNTVVVQFKNLSHNFNAVKVTAHDKDIDTATVEAPSSVIASSSSSNKSVAKSSQDLGLFIINRDKVTHSNAITTTSQKALELSEYQRKVSDEKKVISKNMTAIESYEKAITQQNETIKNYNKQLTETTTNDSQTSIDKARDTLKQIRDKIGDAQQNIIRGKTNIAEYQRTITRVESGTNVLPNPTEI